MDNKTEKVLWAAVAVTVVVALLFIGFMARGDYDRLQTKTVPVTLISYSGTDVVETDTYQMTEKDMVQTGTDNDYVRDNNVTSYGIRIG
jgi:hypothetical protein